MCEIFCWKVRHTGVSLKSSIHKLKISSAKIETTTEKFALQPKIIFCVDVYLHAYMNMSLKWFKKLKTGNRTRQNRFRQLCPNIAYNNSGNVIDINSLCIMLATSFRNSDARKQPAPIPVRRKLFIHLEIRCIN